VEDSTGGGKKGNEVSPVRKISNGRGERGKEATFTEPCFQGGSLVRNTDLTLKSWDGGRRETVARKPRWGKKINLD